ncbi:hypothetical protein [Phenylobacterium sp.]|uniref:hypothetical protein n=1 Tax=Phenylobacterium sp. TaxID=1871053 RepID=UPI0035B2F6B0
MLHVVITSCLPAGDAGDDEGEGGGFGPPLPFLGDELPYKVEVWDASGSFVQAVAAVTANASIGYAAYYAAVRENPERDITLTHRGRVLSRWTKRSH